MPNTPAPPHDVHNPPSWMFDADDELMKPELALRKELHLTNDQWAYWWAVWDYRSSARSTGKGGVKINGTTGDPEQKRWIDVVDALINLDRLNEGDRTALLRSEWIKYAGCPGCGSSGGFVRRDKSRMFDRGQVRVSCGRRCQTRDVLTELGIQTLAASDDLVADWLDNISNEIPAETIAEIEGIQVDDEPDQSTWGRIDLTDILNGTRVKPTPTMFARVDGVHLLYPGLVHSFHGESESGKSLIILLQAVEQIRAGNDVLFLDFESDAESIVDRLIDFGATHDDIAAHFDYRHPEVDPRRHAGELSAWVDLLERDYTLAVIDGVTDALGVFGYATKENDDIATWMRLVPKKIAARTGAAVVIIDHVTKDGDSRGRFAIGGQAKMSGLTGAAYTVEVAEVLGKGLRGVVAIRVGKDRPGAVRPHCGPFRKSDRTQEAARIVVDSTDPAHPTWSIEPPRSGTDAGATRQPFRPTTLMEKISRYLEDEPASVSFNSVNKKVPGKEDHLRAAIPLLQGEGFITVIDGPNNSHLHASVKPYRQAADPLSDKYEPAGYTEVSEWVSPVSRPYTGGRETDTDRLPETPGRHPGYTDTTREPGAAFRALVTGNPTWPTCTCGRDIYEPSRDQCGTCLKENAS